MPASCMACGGPTVVDDAAGVICILCAEIAEPNLVVLTSDIEYPASTTYDGWNPVAPKTVKTARNRYLSAQGKEIRDSKNLDDMHHFIKNLARAAFVSGTTERAYNLFEKAMTSGKYRWGRMAKLVAGACISIALRSSNRPEMFPQLASLLGEKITALTRAFSSVLSTVKPDDFPSSEPKSHVSTLHAHLYAALEGSTESDLPLPLSLIPTVVPLPASTILATANSLSDLLASSVPPSAVAHLPASPTACAVLIWAVEAEARSTLAQLGEMAAFLGAKCNVKRTVVMSRYKVIQDELLERIERIDWLDHYEPNSGKNGRAKISRRLVVARGLKAAIESEREYRRQHFIEARPAKPLNPDGDESDSDDPHSRPRKRRRVQALQQATRFLLNPLAGPLPPSFLPDTLSSHSLSMSLPTYLLTTSVSIRRDKLPSRLQLMSIARGGVGPDEIADEELFEDEELEKIMRTDDEVAEMRNILGWEENVAAEEVVKEPPKPRKRVAKAAKPTTSSKLNPAAVACYFTDEKPDDDFGGLLQLDSDEPGFVIEKDGDDSDVFIGLHGTLVATVAAQEEENEGEPFAYSPSPESDPDDRYAQEYD
ncbi:hypothetical protein DFH07DRAFT_751511 [Mycena maculata]|uniref:TFIIB-type domain-containing protein n=1 Tax=Mycena maculata TaxID=230809 RepID=A0AAD7IDS8_9AGAR|nr:hypothetical protein DFH07DRAFT_751511 [Mycena maculata]